MAFGFVGSASVLGIFNFAFLLYFFSFFVLFAPNHTQGDQAQCLSFFPSCLLLDP